MAQSGRAGKIEVYGAVEVDDVDDSEGGEGGDPGGWVGEEVRLRGDEQRQGGVPADAKRHKSRPVDVAEERQAQAGEDGEGLGVGDEGVRLGHEQKAEIGAHALLRQAHRRTSQPKRAVQHLRPLHSPRPAEHVDEGPSAVAAP